MTKHPLKICLVSPLPPPYGGISHWTEMVSKYAESRVDVQFSIINTAPRWRAIHDRSLWKRAIGGGLQFVRDILLICWALTTCRFDAIHLTTSGQLAVIRDLGVTFIAQLFRVPFIYHIRFGRVPQIAFAKKIEWRLMARVMLRANKVVTIDKATKEAVNKYLPAANVDLIPNCFNFEDLPLVSTSIHTLQTALFIGWVIPTKGIAELIEVWAQLKPPGWRLQIVGPGDTAYCNRLIQQYSPDGVEFLGELPHPQAMELLATCNLFVLPSYTEGFPNVILEAMALGKAIVATEVGAIPEMLNNNCGLLIQPKDVKSLANSLLKLIKDAALRTELGTRARKRAITNYSIDQVFSRYMLLWRQAGKTFK